MQPSDDMKMIPAWWEKTVEYAFVRDVMPTAQEAFPLDGNAETAYGDLLTKGFDGFRLIEFKALRADIAAERKKYASFRKADKDDDLVFHSLLATHESALAKHVGGSAHWLVYGVPNASKTGFTLEARPYAGDGSAVKKLTSQADLPLLTPVTHEVLLSYLAQLEDARGSSTGVATGGGLMVVGVRGGRALALTVEEFKSPKPKPESELDIEFAESLSGQKNSLTPRFKF